MEKNAEFPKGFLWGAATAAYQVEGGIKNADWSKFYPVGKCCDHYHLYEKDFDLLEKLNLNAYRFSIEWSRIEPKEGEFEEKEIEHYRKILLSLKKRGVKSMVTLHHFTNPLWLTEKGGWESKKSIFYFSRFAKRVINEIGELVDFWVTVNEPLVYAGLSYKEGRWPPQKKSFRSFLKVVKNQIKAHRKIYKEFHQINNNSRIGIARNINHIAPYNSKSFLDRFSAFWGRYFWADFYLNKIKDSLDFIGLNYYTRNRIRFPYFVEEGGEREKSDIGWEIFPEGIYNVLKNLKKYKKPIFITENGIADAKDVFRKDFIRDHLCQIHKAIGERVDVRGYFYWSLIDNLEWDSGFAPRFGLVEINYETLERKIRRSAFYYAEVCKNNFLICG